MGIPDPRCQTQADGDHRRNGRILVLNRQRAHIALQLVGDGERVFVGCFRQHAGKLFTTVTRHQISGTAQATLQRSGDHAQCVVSRLMAVAVIEKFEKIDIQKYQRERRIVACCT